jgi:hypothetical protein
MPHRGRRDSQAGLSSARLVSPRCERTSWLATEHAEEESHAVFFTAYLRDLRFARLRRRHIRNQPSDFSLSAHREPVTVGDVGDTISSAPVL